MTGKKRGRPRKPDNELKRPRREDMSRKLEYLQKRPDMTSEEIAVQLPDRKPLNPVDKSVSMEQRQARTAERVAEQMDMLRRSYASGRVDLNDTDDVFEHGMTYLQACVMRGHLPSLMEFCVTMGWTWQGVQNWTRARPEHRTTQVWNIFRDAWTDLRIGLGLERVTDNVLAIYMANNSGTGLSNSPVQEVQKENPLGERKSAEEIKEEFKDLE